MPVSSLIAGSRMLTADVFAFTTNVEMQVAARTPRACPVLCATSLIGFLSAGVGRLADPAFDDRSGATQSLHPFRTTLIRSRRGAVTPRRHSLGRAQRLTHPSAEATA